LLTAVTTAGLLASLFGTALLPVAKAAAADRAVASANFASSDSDVKLTDGNTFYALAAKTIDITLDFVATGEDGDDTIADTLTISVVGTTFATAPGLTDADCTGVLQGLTNKSLSCALSGGEDLTIVVKVLAPAAGATATVTASGLDSGGWDDSAYLVGVSAATVGVPDAAQSSMTKVCTSTDSDGMPGGGAGCYETKTDYINDGGYIGYDLVVEDALGNAVTAYAITATLTGAGGVAGVDLGDNSSTCAEEKVASAVLITDGADYVCVASDGTPTKPFTLTVTVGSLTYTRSIGVVGGIATLSLVGPASIATIGSDVLSDDGYSEAFADAFVVTAKDSAGNIIGNGGGSYAGLKANNEPASGADPNHHSIADQWMEGAVGGTDYDFVVTDGNNLPLAFTTDGTSSLYEKLSDGGTDGEFEDIKIKAGTDSEMGENYIVSNPEDGAYNVPSDFCDSGDEGLTRKTKVTDPTGTISSNVVTTTCVNDAVKLSGFTASATSAVKNASVTFTFTATDGAGRPVGIGAAAGITVTPSWEAASAATLSFSGATASLRYTMDVNSGSHFLIFSRTDNDPITSGNQTWSEKYTVSVTNAADAFTAPSFYKSTAVKARAVAIFPAAAGKTITFTVENANTGVVRTYYRKANADGKAWYTIVARGTFFVTALYNGEATDTLKLVK